MRRTKKIFVRSLYLNYITSQLSFIKLIYQEFEKNQSEEGTSYIDMITKLANCSNVLIRQVID